MRHLRAACLLTVIAAPFQSTIAAPEKVPLILERFEGPLDWSQGNHKGGKADYNLIREGTLVFMRGHFIPGTSGKPIYKKLNWNTDDYPYLQWQWRVNQFTRGAIVKEARKSDAPAQIYVSWKLFERNYVLKYFWAEADPVGTSFDKGRWNPLGRLFALVIRSGGATQQWVTEKRNLKTDFYKAYGKNPPSEAEGLGLLTDGDQTHSEPEADYTDFEALPK